MKKTLLYFALTLCLGNTLLAQYEPEESENSIKFNEVLGFIERMYVDTVNTKQLTETAVVAILEKLDPHSTYISKEEVEEANSSINGSFVGVGIRFQIMKDTVMVVATIPGGPSEKLGILAGDKIVRVDGQSIAGIGIKNNQVREKLMGELGSKVKIEVYRKNVKSNPEFTITRDKIPINSVDASYMLTPEIGYIKLNTFSRTSLEEVQKGLRELKALGMKHLVFDLQDNGGGLLDAARTIADEFLSGEKMIVYSEGRAQPRSELRAYKKGLWEEGSLIMLVDEYSASASEILSGAVQDWDRGLIVGRRSFGKGLVQRPIDLTDGSQIRLTIARYYTPTGRFIQKPYEDADAYDLDIAERYKKGEFLSLDSLHLPDSLRKETLITKRSVYGGGGIIPDVFVPIDTTSNTPFFRNLLQNGRINGFTLDYVDKNRKKLANQYPDFNSFNTTFQIDKKFINEFFNYVEKEDSTWKLDEKEFAQSETDLKLRLKAEIAQNIWGYAQFYQIINETNDIVLRAIEVLKSGAYEQADLDKENK
jgi:carboxyl-terminal processing protease